jgi:GlpG protein
MLNVLVASHLPAVLDEEDGVSVLWIQDDDDRPKAKELLAEFLANPNAPQFVEAERQARKVADEAIAAAAERKRKVIDLRDRWNGVWYKTHPATVVMVVISLLVVAATTKFQDQRGWDLCNDEESAFRSALFIQEPAVTLNIGGVILQLPGKTDAIATIKSGQVWRFITPIFLHFSVLHIFCNMSMFRDLGFAIEFVRGTRRFVLMVLLIAVVSNLAQLYWSGPNFGGMSGVVYGLIGYMWMKGKYQPELGLGLTPNQIVFSILFLLLCMGGAFGPIANAAHLVGLLTGMALGVGHIPIRWIKRALKPEPPSSDESNQR